MTLRVASDRPEFRFAAFVLVSVAVLAGAWLRLSNLATEPLRADELNHYYAAESLRATGTPLLPSGEWYGRALDYTRLVSLALEWTAVPEIATRVPSALFGSLALLILAVGAWRLAGAWPAFWTTALMAFAPALLEQSRNGRMYTMQLAFGLVAMLAGWVIVREAGRPRRPDARGVARKWAWAAAALLAWTFCLRLQVTSLSVAAAWVTAMTTAAFFDVRRWRAQALLTSVPLQLVLLSALAAAGIVLMQPDILHSLANRAGEVPYWARAIGSERLSYARVVLGTVPPLSWVAPIAIAAVVLRRRSLGAYLLAWLAVPLLLHTLLPWKATRFVLLALPALLLLLGCAIAMAIGVVRDAVRKATRRYGGFAREAVAHAAAGALGVALLLANPALVLAAWQVSAHRPAEWRTSEAVLRAALAEDPVPIGHANSLPALHYWGRLDFTVNEGLRERWLSESDRARRGMPEGAGYAILPMGAADLYTGAPVLSTPEAIRTHFAAAGGVIIGIDPDRAVLEGVRGELLDVLEAEAVELCHGSCGRMRLYRWRLGATSTVVRVQ